ncbi:MAG TPA: DEAD/DEAH box helicase, partial [Sphingobacteriaceae bacterium]
MLEFQEVHPHERKTLFVEVVLPLSISKTYTYRVPYQLNEAVQVGKRVIVQFGKSRIYTAVVYRITEEAPAYDSKYLIDVLDDLPVVTPVQLKLWDWMCEYYLCQPGEVMNAALPAALKLASETRILLQPDAVIDKSELSDKEYLIIDALEIQPELMISDIVKLLGQKTVFPILKGLFEKGYIHISEEIQEKYKPRTKAFIRLDPEYQDPDSRRHLFATLEKAPKQLDALLAWFKLSKDRPVVSKADLLEEAGCGPSALKALLDKKIFLLEHQQVSRLASYDQDLEHFSLSEAQSRAHDEVLKGFTEKDVVLLHGITSSGKTQIYVKLIEEMIATGKQVLYLLPEIALTAQIIERLRKYFGEKIGIYHSKFSDNERAEVWQKVLKGEYQVVLGARSSIFLPFSRLGLIIVDEEHETSYKQFDPAPR